MITSWQETALVVGALPEVRVLLLSPIPAWIWSRDGSRVLWANPTGGKVLGGSTLAALFERRWDARHPLRRAVASLFRAMPKEGTLARLRLVEDLHSLPLACRCRPIRASDEERGVLITALEESGAAPSLRELASYLSAPGTDVAILDPAGRALAESRPGIASLLSPLTPRLEFSAGGQPLRLHLLEQAAAGERKVSTPHPDAVSAETANSEFVEPLLGPTPAQSRTTGADRPAQSVETGQAAQEPSEDESDAGREPHRPLHRANGAPPAEKPSPRSVMAGRVAQELSRKPVRFLWQTDAADRFLFVSPGLTQVVGRNADVVGERWQEAAARLRLDPGGRIARALHQRDTWSGLNAWWPIEGSNVRVPVELTALPVFGADQSFQGYRGFGILRPAEALMPATFEVRFGANAPPAEQVPPYEESTAGLSANVVPIRSDMERMADHTLTQQERNAFEEIAAALRERVVGTRGDDPALSEASLTGEAPPIDSAPEPPRAEPVEVPRGQAAADDHPEDAPPAARDEAPPPRSRRDAPREIVIAKSPAPQRASALGSQLAEAERRLREMQAILDTATDGVIILDTQGTIESVNGSAEALFGLDASEMQAKPLAQLLTSESRKLALDYLSGLRDSGVASLLNEGREIEAVAGAGTIPLFMTLGRISSDEDGRFCAVLRDITHWKRVESELTAAKLAAERASGQKSDFLARVSHEIRTPLNAIIGFAEVMIEERFGPVTNERYREYLRDIRTSGEHVVSLVNDLLDISKIEAGKLDLTFAAVSLNDVVRESIALMQPQANRARVVLRSSLSRDVPAIVADERTLRQIVLNLLSNSVKFTGPGGQVIASTSLSEKGEALLRIRDTGEGMSEEELTRALEPFRQLSTAAIGGTGGTGLGLPLTKALVEANRASMTIKSARGEGTVVTITTPPTRVLSE